MVALIMLTITNLLTNLKSESTLKVCQHFMKLWANV